MKQSGLTGVFTAALLFSPCNNASDDVPVEFSGFARVVAGYLDTDQAYFEGYENKVSFSEKSLLGLQADYALTGTVSVSGQVLLHSDESRGSGLEWLYLSYEPNANWQFKAGRLRTPYLQYSDVFDVGYAYPWISPPRQLYGSYLFFPRYEGGNARYQFNIDDIYFGLEGYYGSFSDDIEASGESFHIEVKEMYGGIAEISYRGWQLRGATFISADAEADIAGLGELTGGLKAAGFDDLADYFSLMGRVDAYLVGISYDSLDWFMSAEYVDVESTINILAGIENYYVTLGRYFGDYQLLVTYAKSNQILGELNNTIPVGLDPQLDMLYYGVEQLQARFPTDVLDSVTLTGRWDFRPGMALKAEVTFLDGEPGKTSLFELKAGSENFDRQAVLYQFGLEWVF
ncbi:hypothetical protein J3369_16955 [Alteromonas sp. NFXS44]|uniref:hypothetical protein n=1 Tax=Alteromonas sp. NFXS44 TaxID=2818435 RepID=UPI0032E02A7E